MSAFPVYSAFRSATIGADTAASTGTAVTSGAANTKGSYAQISASTPIACDGFWFDVFTESPTSYTEAAFDIAVGAGGSEQIVFPDLLLGVRSTGRRSHQVWVPIAIPAGSRVAVRAQCEVTTLTSYVVMRLQGIQNTSAPGYSAADALGFVSGTTRGPQVNLSGSANTKSAYTEIVASTARQYTGLLAVLRTYSAKVASPVGVVCLTDIAIGAGGAETIFVENMLTAVRASNEQLAINHSFYPAAIPAGSRLAFRSQGSSSDGTNYVGLMLYGLH